MKRVFTILWIVSLTALSCNQTKKTIEVPNENNTSSTASVDVLNFNDSLLISFEQSACYGTCPIHKMYIYQNGSARYTGIRYTKLTGEFSATFSRKEIDAILAKANELSFFESQKEYTSPVTDFPTTKIYIHNDNEKHLVIAHADYPENIQLMIAFLFEVSQNKNWQEVE